MDLTKILGAIIPAQKVVIGNKTTTKSSGIPIDVRIGIDPELAKTLVKFGAGIGLGVAAGMITREVIRNRNRR